MTTEAPYIRVSAAQEQAERLRRAQERREAAQAAATERRRLQDEERARLDRDAAEVAAQREASRAPERAARARCAAAAAEVERRQLALGAKVASGVALADCQGSLDALAHARTEQDMADAALAAVLAGLAAANAAGRVASRRESLAAEAERYEAGAAVLDEQRALIPDLVRAREAIRAIRSGWAKPSMRSAADALAGIEKLDAQLSNDAAASRQLAADARAELAALDGQE